VNFGLFSDEKKSAKISIFSKERGRILVDVRPFLSCRGPQTKISEKQQCIG
jgi:hypothetical protein